MATGEITLYIATSVDGFIAAEDGGVGWLDEFQSESDEGDDGGYEAFFEDVDALVMGARTYEQVLSFGEWPYEDRPTYVLTHSEDSPDIDNVEFVDDEVNTLSDRLRGLHDRIWLVGGAQVAQSFLREGKIDELRLSLVPLLLGDGIRLFGETGTRERLELVSNTAHDDGIVEVHYDVKR